MVAAAGDLYCADSSDILACARSRFAASCRLRASRSVDGDALEQYLPVVFHHSGLLSRHAGVAGGDGGLHSYRMAENAQHSGHEAGFFLSGAGVALCNAARRIHGVA